MKQFDKDFIHKLKHHDHDAFNEFYLQTVDMFFRYIQCNYFLSPQDSEDIIADFYVKRWEVIKTYDEEQSFMWYVRTVLKNMIKDHFKKMHDIPFTMLSWNDEEETFQDTLPDDIDLEKLLEQSFTVDTIMHAMKKLDDASKDILYRKFIEEKTYREMEDLLGLTPENVRQRLSRALKKLKSLLWSK